MLILCNSDKKINRVLRYICGPKLESLTSMSGELWHEKAQNFLSFEFDVIFDLEGQGQSTPQTISCETKVFCTSGSNLVILA